MRGISKAELVGRELIEKYGGAFISRRDGHVLVKVVEDNKTVVIWVRQSPVTEESLKYLNKLLRKHKYDKLVLLKLHHEADYVTFQQLEEIFDEIKTHPTLKPFLKNEKTLE